MSTFMQQHVETKLKCESQVTRLEAVLAKMIELEASQDPYMLQVVIWFPPYFPPCYT